MAIYHMQAKVVSRGSGRSAVAASAYMSCSRMYNDYDGIQHDYTRKHGLIYQEVMLVVVKHFCNTLFENSPGISSFKWCFPIIVGMRTDMIVPYVHISV